MHTQRRSTLLCTLPLALALATVLNAQADSGIGVDTWRANKLDPSAGAQGRMTDEFGTSWLIGGQRRSPTGNLYMCPAQPPQLDHFGDWIGYGVLEAGAVGTSGDDRNALWNRYADWDSGLILGLLDYTWQRPDDGSYANVRASRISEDDQYYQAVFGRAGAFKIQAFIRDQPNLVSSNAKPIWNGVGSDQLTLPTALTPGGSTVADVAAVSAATPERTLSVKRSKQGIGFDLNLPMRWSVYANLADEQRKGARPYGGPFFFNYPFPNNGGVLETTKPIDDHTLAINLGVRHVATQWRMDFSYSGSFYRDRYTRYTYQTPFALWAVVPGSASAPLTTGQMAMEPDNDYHNIKAAFTYKLPLNGELSLTASAGRMSQDDRLIAPIDCNGVFGIGLGGNLNPGPANPFLFRCSDWNTPAALSRRTADMRIDTSLLDARISLQPLDGISVRGGLRFNRDDYRNGYLAYNPLTGDYGYIAENGSQGSIVPGEVGLFNPVTAPSNITRVRSLPLDLQTIDANLGADWKLDNKNTLGATFAFNRYEPTHRERRRIDDNSLKLTWVNRSLDWLTLRANYTWKKSNGDPYEFDPYEFTYSIDLPGYVPPAGGTPSHTVEAMRKYDMSSRDGHKIDVMATIMPREDMTLSASLRGDWNSYDAPIGRQDYQTSSATLQWDWQPRDGTNLSAYAAWDRSHLRLSNVQDQQAGAGVDPRLGGPNYALIGQWWLRDSQRDVYAGATLDHRIGRVRIDANWNYTRARGMDRYNYAGPTALAYPALAPGAGPGGGAFPAMTYRVDSISVGVTIPLADRFALRVFDYYERGRVSDWHYSGFDTARVIDHRVYTDGGPTRYNANLVGVMLRVAL
ncbi:MAG: MtrB/PioB family outer membrane beta-barrel protein [Dokdonella sp.]|uniref:MtrB/PioB family outer membrane beta-barrel protein n=1 Tax=Dokdonella sp. TaxID=2291710 RepID=UPI0025C02575|nr:MtrB/PioB family outer membrane beta-barrel protein [Dokdonella sp.]MBZ0223859.1 MtrB/PioB family outer membrane beta-barrel protein [Dokdonella sp.]